ncbi:CotO family spore coat protein [Bacillus sp. AK031]
MKKQKTSGKAPLLYIQQPAMKETKANMQQSYSSRNAKPKQTAKAEAVPEKKQKRKKRTYFEEELGSLYGEAPAKDQVKEELEEPNTNKTHETETQPEENQKRTYSFKPLKPFREMELDEKINYLSRYINGKAPFPCEFVTAEEHYKGILLQDGNDTLVVKTFQGDEAEIKRSSLKAIKIIGL